MSQPDYMMAGRSERPTGISILSVLHIISELFRDSRYLRFCCQD